VRVRLEHLPADVFGLPDIARAALAHARVNGLPVPRRAADIARPRDRLDVGERELLARAIRAGLEPLEPPQRVRTSLNVLARAGSFAVVTGQQPGFLCAPLYSLYKALQACRLAHELSSAWGVPVVPIFWNHADDHDVAEVHHTWVQNRNLDLAKVGLAGFSSGRQPLSRLVLDEEAQRLGSLRALLKQSFGMFEHFGAALEVLFPRSGETLAGAFTRAFTTLLGAHGLVVVEPDWIRDPLSRALADVIERDPRAPLAAARALEHPPGIEPETAALLFRVDEDGRRPLRIGGDGFRYDGEAGSRTPAELAAEIVDDPPGWSAGALLRPLVQDSVFPACAYVGGWGELGYHAQLGPLRDAAELPRTPFVPRISCTVLDDEARLSLRKCGAGVAEVLAGRGEFTAREDDVPEPAVIAGLRADADAAARALLAHKPALVELEHTLGAALKRAVDSVRGATRKVLDKAERVHANKTGKGRRHERRLNGALMPRGLPQERVLGPLQFSARYGWDWIEALYSEFPALSAEHLVVHLDGGASEATEPESDPEDRA
jgi:bacillithiol biosynthesis cysteine-adding enzyme BshC